MLEKSVFHEPKSRFAYAYDQNTLHIRLRTGRDEADAVYLLWDDPFEWSQNEDGSYSWDLSHRDPMQKIGSTDVFDYWFCEIRPPYKRVKYAFEIHQDENIHTYSEQGFVSEERSRDSGHYFTFPYINSEDVFQAPQWVKDTVWYQIFPERFADGNPDNNPPGTLPWGSVEPAQDSFFGGDLQGIIDQIGHLADMGITGLYLTPIFKASSNHKYDTIDYMELDPQFGDKETLKELVKTCHNHGIRVMLDAVFNHSGYHFPPFQDVLEKGEQSPYKDWFYIREYPITEKPRPSYETFGFTPAMPKLNTSNAELKEYLLEAGRYWVREFDIDGWRLDVANEVSHSFWREFRQEVKKIKPDVYILGEIWHDAMPWLQGDQFDAVMNYPFTSGAIEFFAKNTLSPSEFRKLTVEALLMYPQNVAEAAFNLLGSHDTARILTVAGGNVQKVKQLFTYLLSAVGTPCIYYGDEIGMEGGMDPGCRRCMEWDESKQDRRLYHYIKTLISLRKTNKAFGPEGIVSSIEADDEKNTILIKKSYGDEELFVLYNHSDEAQALDLPEGCDAGARNLITGEVYSGSSLMMEAHGTAVIGKNQG
ncbi:glycoside hydrolase family 13 protein [Peribacillus sp. SCS-26]|uniref:glycoside hydrolase family 13 protein n=1 Tax=Paraperibacillus marinus TaxID=3115295 RepID=UPI003906CB4A